MRKFIRLSMMFLCGLFVLSACSHTPVEPAPVETTPAETKDTDRKLQLPDESHILALSAYGEFISAVYENGSMYHVAVFSEDGTPICEPLQNADVLSASFLDSGELAIWHSDVLEVWDVDTNTKVNSYKITEGSIPDADGQAVWHTETIEKNNEVDVPTTYITKAVRTTTDNKQNVLEMPDGTTTLLYAKYPYLYYKKEAPDYKLIICRINVVNKENTELTDWVRGKDTPMGHVSKLFQSEILMPWELPGQMFVAHHAQMIARDGTTLLVQGDDGVCAIDAENKTLLLQVPYDGTIVAGAVMEEKQCFVLADTSSATVYHWEDKGTATDMAEMVDLTNISDAIKTQRENLLAMYGITVTNDETIVAEQYQPKALDSELRSYVGGIEMTNFFALLPHGLIDEMRPAELQTFSVCFTGYMNGAGLSMNFAEECYIALDLNFLYGSFLFNEPSEEVSPFIDAFPHEFMHMLEYHLTQTKLPDGEPILSLWDATVPPGENETFTGTYEGEWDARNSLESEDPADEIWFESAYSRTMPQEDRSTLFSCLISGVHCNGEGWDAYYPHLLEKGQLLCAIIREGYPSIKATPEGSMYWERNFEQLPLSSFLPQK